MQRPTIVPYCKNKPKDFPGGPVVKTPPSNAGGEGSVPGQGAKISRASWLKNPKHNTETIQWKIQKRLKKKKKNKPHSPAAVDKGQWSLSA